MFLQKNLMTKLQSSAAMRKPLGTAMRASVAGQTQVQTRPYFSVFEKIKDRFRTPMKHIQGFAEPDGYAYESQMPEGYRLHGNSAASFSASLT